MIDIDAYNALFFEAMLRNVLIKLKFVNGLNRESFTLFQPYIRGEDAFQNDFVWGYVLSKQTFYKFLYRQIISVEITDIPYTIVATPMYLYQAFEEHHSVLGGFDNIYASAPPPTTDEEK